MTGGLILSGQTSVISWRDAEALAPEIGEKAARLLTLPREWVPEFAALSINMANDLAGGTEASMNADVSHEALRLAKITGQLILRSSVPGETIWERGTYDSVVIDLSNEKEFLTTLTNASKHVMASAAGRACAVLMQAYIAPTEMGEFGNLLRVSRTRDHWELSTRIEGGLVQSDRLNSQRDIAPSASKGLSAKARLARERLFGSIGAWINNELLRGSKSRVNCEWVRAQSRFFIVQIDGEDEDIQGVNPMQLYIETSVIKGASSGVLLKVSDLESRAQWDKLAVLDELYDESSTVIPNLFFVPLEDLLASEDNGLLEKEFAEKLEKNIVVRTSVRRGADKIINLPKTDCMTPSKASEWCYETAKKLSTTNPGAKIAFIAHRYIGARASAWVRANPLDPVVEVHGNWGLPDALQFCPYDTWDVHLPTEEVTEYTNYKSDVLLLKQDGNWRYERVRNDIARFQSIRRDDVISIARATADIAARMNTACHVMWFVEASTANGTSVNIPWYWTEAHETDNPDRGNLQIMRLSGPEGLAALPELKKKNRRLAVSLRPNRIELLRDNGFLADVAAATTPLDIPVLLSGSTLAHAFFQLRKLGCVVIPEGDRDHQRMRKQATFGKIVRDKIPAKIASLKERQQVTTIPPSSRSGFLIGKFIEEVLEAREAGDEDSRRVELADVYEVWRALLEAYGEDKEAVIREADKKKEKSGGFNGGQLLVSTSLSGAGANLTPQQKAPSFELMSEMGEDGVFRVPFTFFGFSEIGQPRLLRFADGENDLEIVLQRDCIEFKLHQKPKQLVLDFQFSA